MLIIFWKKKCLELCYGHVVCTICAVFQTDEMRGQNAAFLMAFFMLLWEAKRAFALFLQDFAVGIYKLECKQLGLSPPKDFQYSNFWPP